MPDDGRAETKEQSMVSLEKTPRDRTRRPAAKARTISRRTARRLAIARRFLILMDDRTPLGAL
jgi:hypothetical protein